MGSASQTKSSPAGERLILLLLVGISLTISVAAVWTAMGSYSNSLLAMSNLVGPTTQSLLAGGGLSVCTEDMGTPGNPVCFHAGRMPMASLVTALGIRLLGDHAFQVDILKTLLLLLPLELAIYLAWKQMPPPLARRLLCALLLLLPFAMTPFLADVVNMQVEEGYSYSMLALALSVLFFAIRPGKPASFAYSVAFGLAVDGLYLAKSSMAPTVAVLVVSYLLLEKRLSARSIVLALAIAAPLGWALHQHHASGRYSIGTSLDGINLHKSNNPTFLQHYPPPPGDTLDRYDGDLNRGQHFADEWSFNDFHEHAAVAYMTSHPGDTFTGDLRKFNVLFFSIRKSGSAENTGRMRYLVTASLAVFRILLWTAIVGALFWILRPTPGRPNRNLPRLTGGIFIAVIAACVLPYMLGFAYTRHVSILIYPSVLMCCRMLAEEKPTDPATG
jgi:hypothetical protein